MNSADSPSTTISRRGLVLALVFAGILALAGLGSWPRSAQAEDATPQNTIPTAKIWFVHAAPFASSAADSQVTVTISNTTTFIQVKDLAYLETTGGYMSLPSGQPTEVKVLGKSGTIPPVALTFTPEEKAYTLAYIGGTNGHALELLKLTDDNSLPVPGKGKLRVVHVAPFATSVPATVLDVRTQGGAIMAPSFESLFYRKESGYQAFSYGPYDLKASVPASGTTLFDIPPFVLGNQGIVTLFLVGDGTNQPLQALRVTYQPGQDQLLYLPLVQK